MNLPSELLTFTPHGFCLAWDPVLIWLHAASDLLIAAAYFSIPAALLVFLRRRRDLAFKPLFGLFAAFILACGTTHVLGAVTLWRPLYWLDGTMKAITAVLSVATAATLWPLIPKALALPSPVDLRQANVALGKEIAQSVRVEAELRHSKAQIDRLYARSPAALHAVDADGIVVDVSDRWLELAGFARAEVVGQPIARFYSPLSAAVSAADLQAMREGQDHNATERQLVRRDGRLREVSLVLSAERDEAGRLERILASVTDVTEAREAQAALRATEEQLHHAQKIEAVGQLTGGIAHDFNNLLTTIMGSLELLQQRSNLDQRGLRLVNNAFEGARRAARLTSQLLSFSRRQRLSPQVVMPGAIVAGIFDLLARTLGDRIALHVEETAEEGVQWPLLADTNQVESALLNLIINARDAIDGDGRVTISISNRSLPLGRHAKLHDSDTLAAGDYVCIAVSDTGHGMSDEVRLRAFEPFFTTKPPGAGTGLGLSQIYGFVQQSGGAVSIASLAGQGATIEMLLPRAHGLAQPALSEPASALGRGGGEHVLMVEDDDLLRRTMAEALESCGFVVIQAANADEALSMLRDNSVEILFTDVRMPGPLSGVDLARKVREGVPALPVLFATGFAEAYELDGWQAREDIMAKPYTIEEAVNRIKTRVAMRTG